MTSSDMLVPGETFEVRSLDFNFQKMVFDQAGVIYTARRGDRLTYLRKDLHDSSLSVTPFLILKFLLSSDQRVAPMYTEAFAYWNHYDPHSRTNGNSGVRGWYLKKVL